jgi:ABC-type branched-subunit amino acid transport system substrate-binding protein
VVAETATAAAPTSTTSPSPTPENIPDLSGESIVLPALCDKSSVLASENNARIQAMEDVADAINAQGGIFGARLELRVVDSAGNAEEAQRALARTVRKFGEGPLLLICDPQTETALSEMVNEDEISALGPGDFAERDGMLFGSDATQQEHLGYFLDDLVAHWSERKPQGAGDEIRLALISWPAEVSGVLTSEQFLADLEELGVQVVFQAELPAELDANVFDLIYQIRDNNANVIYTNMRGFGLAELLNGLNNLGLRERFVLGTPAAGYGSQLFEYLGSPTYAQGLFVTSAWSWWSEENIGVQFLATLGNGADVEGWGYIQMAGAVALAQKSLEEAILNEGFEDLSPEAVTRALSTIEDYPVMSGLYSVDYSGGSRSLEGLRTWVAGAASGDLVLTE